MKDLAATPNKGRCDPPSEEHKEPRHIRADAAADVEAAEAPSPADVFSMAARKWKPEKVTQHTPPPPETETDSRMTQRLLH